MFARSWYFRLASLNAVRVGVLQIVAVVDALAQSAQGIRCAILRSDRVDAQATMVHAMHIYGRLWRCTADVRERFKWSLLMLLVDFFICMTIGLYWVVLRFVYGRWELMFGESRAVLDENFCSGLVRK